MACGSIGAILLTIGPKVIVTERVANRHLLGIYAVLAAPSFVRRFDEIIPESQKIEKPEDVSTGFLAWISAELHAHDPQWFIIHPGSLPRSPSFVIMKDSFAASGRPGSLAVPGSGHIVKTMGMRRDRRYASALRENFAANYRDTALRMALHCVRNTIIEDYHAAGKLTDAEMAAFNREVASKIYSFLQIMSNPEHSAIRQHALGWLYRPDWEDPVFDESFMFPPERIDGGAALPRQTGNHK